MGSGVERAQGSGEAGKEGEEAVKADLNDPTDPFAYVPREDWVIVTPEHVSFREAPAKAGWFERVLGRIWPPRIGTRRWCRLHGVAGKELEVEDEREAQEC